MKRFYVSLTLCILCLVTKAQDSLFKYQVEAQGIYNSNGQVPFWFRSNQFGSVPLSGASTSFIARAVKDFASDKSKFFDWAAGFEGRANLGKEAQATLIEGYAKIRLGMFQLKGGRSKEVTGIVGDSSLSSGSFSVSGNALGIPQVSLSVPEYYTIPVFDGLFAVKGNFAHGWLGTLPLGVDYRIQKSKTYFHQKSLYARIGKIHSKLKFYGGFNNQVFWGNYNNIFPESYDDLTTWSEFVKVVFGQVHEGSKVGNHIGSVDVALEFQLKNIKILMYRQNLYDIGALSKLANLRDGLSGLTITNNSQVQNGRVHWHKLLFEVFYTKNQAGESWSKPTKSGAENYYNNYQYENGWSYQHQSIGNPFITDRRYAVDNLASHPSNYFINNRLILIHMGLEGSLNNILIRSKLSFSRNYGTFRTSGGKYRLFGNVLEADPTLYFTPVNQFSYYLEGRKSFKNNIQVGLMLAGDQGKLLYNSTGIKASIAKSFN